MKKKSLALALSASFFSISICFAAPESTKHGESTLNSKSVSVEFSKGQSPLVISLSDTKEIISKSHDYCPGPGKYCEDDEKCCQIGATTWCEKKNKSCEDYDK